MNNKTPVMHKTLQNAVPFQSYFGGKSGAGVYQSIINHIPPHRVFMSLFAGNCGVFKNMRRAEWSIINDIDPDVGRAWHATGLDVAGDLRLYIMDALVFLRTQLTSPEYSRLLKHTFIYLDPPYLKETRKSQSDTYRYEFGKFWQHNELIETVKSLPSYIKVMISHYPCDLYDNELSDWNTFDFKAQTRRGQAVERIYMNYELNGTLHDYSYIGRNFRQREAYNRQLVNFTKKLDRMEPLLRNAMLQAYELQHQ